MLSEPALRSEFLLLTLEMAGPFDSKAMLHRTAYLAQAMSGTTQYDFKPHPYGVYSEDLDRDIENLGMVSKSVYMPYPNYSDSHYVVKLSPDGKAKIAGLGDSHMPDGPLAALPMSLAKIKDMDEHDLVEEVCTIHPHTVDHDDINSTMLSLIPKLTAYSKRNDDRPSDFVLYVLETVRRYLKIDDRDLKPQQNMVILLLAHELVKRCSDIFDALTLPADIKTIKPKLVELSEVERLLRGYCHDKKIKDDIFRLPFGKAFTEEELDKLAQVVDNLDIDAICEEIRSERNRA